MTYLFDLNLLLALAWPSHMHHGLAHDRFSRLEADKWASCPVTQLGFVRLSSNKAFTSDAVSSREAVEMLRMMTAQGHHEFWPDTLDCCSKVDFPTQRLVGHRQVTDSYLLALAIKRGGVLVTLDRRMRQLAEASGPALKHLEIVETN